MIYWPQNTQIETYIPNVLGVQGVESPYLAIINNVGRKVYEGAVELTRISPLYFVAEIGGVSELPAGEYTYRLTDGDMVLSEGLVIVGEYEVERNEYKKVIEYEQY